MSVQIAGCASGLDDGDRTMGSSFRLEAQDATVSSALSVCADGDTVFGIDVSKWQGDIDWAQVAGDGVQYAFIRVSDGENYIDQKFNQNWAGTKTNGIRRGAYQFFRSNQDPLAQANLLLDRMGPLEPGDLPPVIDVESSDGQSPATVAANVGIWIDHVEAALGVKPIIYSGKYFWQNNVTTDAFAENPLWHAQYPSQSSPGNNDYVGVCPNIADAWSSWTFWQYASTGVIAGIGGSGVDINRFNGDAAALEALAGGTVVCGDGHCSASEDNASCAADCPVCESIPATGAIIDDDDLCFSGAGNPTYIRDESGAGYGAGLQWTKTWVSSSPDNYAQWNLDFDVEGDYRIEAYTDASFAQWTQAHYRVLHQGSEDNVAIDQTATDGWASLGVFHFAAGDGQSVQLDDNVSDQAQSGLQILWDAIAVTPVSEGSDTGSISDGGIADSSIGDSGVGDSGVPESADLPDAGVQDGPDQGGNGYSAAPRGNDSNGATLGDGSAGSGFFNCSCSAAHSPVPWSVFFGLIPVLFVFRPRRRVAAQVGAKVSA